MNSKNPTVASVVAVLNSTDTAGVALLEQVKHSFITNYNICNKSNLGELAYWRQVAHFTQLINASTELQKVDKFSVYACLTTLAIKDWSCDPLDDEVYLLALKGKAVIWPQAGAHIKRLIKSKQIVYADQPKFIYDGDEPVIKNGRVVEHIERMKTETILAAYIRFVLDENGSDRFFIYRKSDWDAWKAKSQNKANWTSGINGQPDPGFLRTKIVKHACKEKCWATGQTDPAADTFLGTIIEDPDEVRQETETTATPVFITNAQETPPIPNEESPAPPPVQPTVISPPTPPPPQVLTPEVQEQVETAINNLVNYKTVDSLIAFAGTMNENVRNNQSFRQAVLTRRSELAHSNPQTAGAAVLTAPPTDLSEF
jgi:hypothetical protein